MTTIRHISKNQLKYKYILAYIFKSLVKEEVFMTKKFIAALVATVGALAATVGSQACLFYILDEPTCPKSLIK